MPAKLNLSHLCHLQCRLFWTNVAAYHKGKCVFMDCITGSRMHWMLLTVNYTPTSPHLFIQEDVQSTSGLCSRKDSIQYIFSIVSWHVFLLCCRIVHMYLWTECLCWDEMHSQCYLCIVYIVLNAKYNMSDLLLKCMRLSSLAWKCHG